MGNCTACEQHPRTQRQVAASVEKSGGHDEVCERRGGSCTTCANRNDAQPSHAALELGTGLWSMWRCLGTTHHLFSKEFRAWSMSSASQNRRKDNTSGHVVSCPLRRRTCSRSDTRGSQSTHQKTRSWKTSPAELVRNLVKKNVTLRRFTVAIDKCRGAWTPIATFCHHPQIGWVHLSCTAVDPLLVFISMRFCSRQRCHTGLVVSTPPGRATLCTMHHWTCRTLSRT